uniref:Uncharacterized protein n=1 Tax=Arundo donax TaxID=35708 RepID=A0A0A8YXM0_ARUDO
MILDTLETLDHHENSID